MPKEVVQHPASDGFAEYSGTGTELSIHWDKDCGFVQIGLTRHIYAALSPDAIVGHPVHADHHHCNECVTAVAQNNQRKVDGQPQMMSCEAVGSPAPPIAEFDGPSTVFTTPLTRAAINRMIRTLRRARDQAFGPDE